MKRGPLAVVLVMLNRSCKVALVSSALAVAALVSGVVTGVGLGTANAATVTADLAQSRTLLPQGFPADLTGIVGVIAVLIGLAGLVFGLIRQRHQAQHRAEQQHQQLNNTLADHATARGH